MSEYTIQCLAHGTRCLHCGDYCKEEVSRLKAENEKLKEAGESLKGFAQSYAAQTYDRLGTVKKAVDAWEEALSGGATHGEKA